MMPVMVFGQLTGRYGQIRDTMQIRDTIIITEIDSIYAYPYRIWVVDPDPFIEYPSAESIGQWSSPRDFAQSLNSLLQDYKQYCEADSILVGYEFVIAEGESFRDAWRVYNVDYIRYFGYAPYDNFDYMWGTPDKVWERRLEKTMYDSYRHNTYIRCEDIRLPQPITLEGFIEWMENKYK